MTQKATRDRPGSFKVLSLEDGSAQDRTNRYLRFLGKNHFTGKVTFHLQHGHIKKITEEKEVHLNK